MSEATSLYLFCLFSFFSTFLFLHFFFLSAGEAGDCCSHPQQSYGREPEERAGLPWLRDGPPSPKQRPISSAGNASRLPRAHNFWSKLTVTNIVHSLRYLEMRRNEDLLPASSKFMYITNKSLNGQAPSETESMITKWSVWINRAQFGGYLLSILGWILCITSTATDHWRIWHVKSKDNLYPGLLWIGIWRACYLHSTHPENRYVHCEDFTEDLKMLPNEIFLAQDLLSLCCIVGAVGITLMSFALWNVVRAITHKSFLLTLFNVGGLMNFLTGIIILIPISWNSYSILINADIMFPDSFSMPTSPVRQEIGAAIYIGYIAAILLLMSGVMIICNKRVFQNRRENHVLNCWQELTFIEKLVLLGQSTNDRKRSLSP